MGENTWPEWWDGLPLHDDASAEMVRWLLETGHLERDSGMLFLGEEAQRRYGRKNFLELVSVFTANPEFLVVSGRNEIGSVDPLVLTRRMRGPRVMGLAGHSWRVTHIDWKRRRCFVEPSDARATTSWGRGGRAEVPLSFELCRAERDVLAGYDPDITLSRRATAAISRLREARGVLASKTGTVSHRDGDLWWWTWAGVKANATLARALPAVVDPDGRYDNHRVRIRADATSSDVSAATAAVQSLDHVLPETNDEAVGGLKFADVLPPRHAADTVARRLADPASPSVSRLSR